MDQKETIESGSRSRAVLYGAGVIFLLSVSVLVFAGARLALRAGDAAENAAAAVEPISDRVRELFVAATPVILPNPATIVNEINDLARLETASYELEKVITADSGQEGLVDLFLGESMVFVAHGKVFAGVDLATMTPEDLAVVDPDTVMVHLPQAEIFSDIPVLDTDQSYVADRDTGLLTKGDPNLETQVRQAAEDAILEAAQSSDILDRANFNAQQYMTGFLEGLGFTEVIFTQDIPTDVPPYEQPVPKGYLIMPTPSPAGG
ncbi:MAG: DUF4230 domain-containing protein [Chloroflexota bacterium]